jgi:hypothetical protein
MAQLYPQALGYLFISVYNSQGYGGGGGGGDCNFLSEQLTGRLTHVRIFICESCRYGSLIGMCPHIVWRW